VLKVFPEVAEIPEGKIMCRSVVESIIWHRIYFTVFSFFKIKNKKEDGVF